MVHNDGQTVRDRVQGHQPLDPVWPHDWRTDVHARNVRASHDLRFAQRGAADPDRARCHLAAGDLDRFVRFGVWTQPLPGRAAMRGHGSYVRFQRVQVDQQRGRVEFLPGPRLSDQAGVWAGVKSSSFGERHRAVWLLAEGYITDRSTLYRHISGPSPSTEVGRAQLLINEPRAASSTPTGWPTAGQCRAIRRSGRATR